MSAAWGVLHDAAGPLLAWLAVTGVVVAIPADRARERDGASYDVETAEATPAQTFLWALGEARGQSTSRLRRRDRRYRRLVARRAHVRGDLASWAAVRPVLRERGVALAAA